MSSLQVSVIVPVLNEGLDAQPSLESARRAGADEIIVVDGGSTDNTRESCQPLCDRLMQTESGRSLQQNHGAAAACGDVLLFLHADCTLPDDGIHAIRAALSNSPRSIGGCFRQHIDAPERIYRVIEAGNTARVRVLGWAYGDQGLFFRQEAFARLGAFPELRLMEDLYLMKRVRRRDRFLVLDPRLTVDARRWKKQGVMRQTLRNWRLILSAHLGWSPDRLKEDYPDVR